MPAPLTTAVAITAAAGLVAGGIAYASLYPTSQIFGRVLIAGRNPRQLALTYDDGPNPAVTPYLLDLLARHEARATFFLIGSFVRQQPALARQVAAAGHIIGNHTVTHPKLAWQSSERIRQELRDASHLIEDAVRAPVHYFRPPHGSRRPYVIRAATELGLRTVLWNVTAADWNPIGADAITANVERGIRRNQSRNLGSNILLHDGGHRNLGADRQATIEATQRTLIHHAADHFVTVDAWS